MLLGGTIYFGYLEDRLESARTFFVACGHAYQHHRAAPSNMHAKTLTDMG